MSDTKPALTKKRIVDRKAAKIAKAKIKNGQITVTATGKASGVVYLWVMDTGNKGVSECCTINVIYFKGGAISHSTFISCILSLLAQSPLLLSEYYSFSLPKASASSDPYDDIETFLNIPKC